MPITSHSGSTNTDAMPPITQNISSGWRRTSTCHSASATTMAKTTPENTREPCCRSAGMINSRGGSIGYPFIPYPPRCMLPEGVCGLLRLPANERDDALRTLLAQLARLLISGAVIPGFRFLFGRKLDDHHHDKI